MKTQHNRNDTLCTERSHFPFYLALHHRVPKKTAKIKLWLLMLEVESMGEISRCIHCSNEWIYDQSLHHLMAYYPVRRFFRCVSSFFALYANGNQQLCKPKWWRAEKLQKVGIRNPSALAVLSAKQKPDELTAKLIPLFFSCFSTFLSFIVLSLHGNL